MLILIIKLASLCVHGGKKVVDSVLLVKAILLGMFGRVVVFDF